MATEAHCAYVFESLTAHFEKRQPLSLARLEELWEEWQNADEPDAATTAGAAAVEDAEDDAEMTDAEAETEQTPKSNAISRLLNRKTGSESSSSTSLPSTRTASSSASNTPSTGGTATPASSVSSGSKSATKKHSKYPLFVTWNTHSTRTGHKSLRGCIGTFEAQDLEYGLHSYALTAGLEDARFSPIPASLLPHLSAHVTLLTDFSSPVRDPLDWIIGVHGIRISFYHHGRRYGATYLPDVAKEQGWSKEEALISLMRKSGWNGRSGEWKSVWEKGRGELVRYEGRQCGIGWEEFSGFKEWVAEREALG